MKFITNKISTGKVKNFEEIVASYAKKEQVKVASTKETVKVAEADEADSSGQLDVEPLHQTGESTTMPKNGPSAKSEGDTPAASSPSGSEKEEGEDSGQPKAEAKLVNTPEKPKESEATEEEVKEAGIKGNCEKCGKPNFLCKGKCSGDGEEKEDDEKEKEDDGEDKEASSQKRFIRLANLDGKSKNWLSTYWKKIYPADYVDAMLADK